MGNRTSALLEKNVQHCGLSPQRFSVASVGADSFNHHLCYLDENQAGGYRSNPYQLSHCDALMKKDETQERPYNDG
jgi:hypothetical protein